MKRLWTDEQRKAMFASMRGKEGGRRAAGVLAAAGGLLLAKKGKGIGRAIGLGLAAAGGGLAAGYGDKAITEAKVRAALAKSEIQQAGKFASVAASGYSQVALNKLRDFNLEKAVGAGVDFPFLLLEGKIAADMAKRAERSSQQSAKVIGGWSAAAQQAIAQRVRQAHGKALRMSPEEIALRTQKGHAALRESTRFLTEKRPLRTAARDIKFRSAAMSLLSEMGRMGQGEFRVTPALIEAQLRKQGLADTEKNRRYLMFLFNAGRFMGTMEAGL